MSLRSCNVTIKDMEGVSHTVEVTAETLYEAVALGMAAIRTDEWVTGIAQGLNPVKVRVTNVSVEHEVKLMDFTKWLDRSGGSPREMTERKRIRSILGMDKSNSAGGRCEMKPSFAETLIEVWRQALVDNAKAVVFGNKRYPIVRTSKRKLREVDFVFDDKEIRGLEQNPETKSRWAAMARDGKKVMQFLVDGRYVANVVDGKMTFYKK
jgi:hypothetical protein